MGDHEAAEALEHTDGKYRVSKLDGTPMQPGEPVFVFRAQDAILPDVLDFYGSLCESAGSPPEHVDAVRAHRERILDWQLSHTTKIPD